MVHVINFSESLEHELKELGAEVQGRQSATEVAPTPERTVVRESIRSFAERVEVPSNIEKEPAASSPTPQSTPAATPSDSPLPSYLDSPTTDPEVKRAVEDLIRMTFSHGLMHGLREARRASPFIEDAFHDALVDKLIPEMKRRGLMK
jgi:hypothetical protein